MKLYMILIVGLLLGAANAQNFAVGNCLPQYPQYPTIQLAVSGVTPGSTIFVCPNVYPEQVTIKQPLTLQGVSRFFAGQDRPVIAVPPGDPAAGGGLQSTVTTFTSAVLAPQIIVQNVNPAGPVNIINMTVDGSGFSTICANFAGIAGIYFGPGTSGSIKGSSLRNQNYSSCGLPIWVENGGGPTQSIEISNNSIHDYDGQAGIYVLSMQSPTSLNADILSNSVSTHADYSAGIFTSGIPANIAHNLLTGSGTTACCLSVGITSVANAGVSTITDNDLTNWQTGIMIEDASTAKSNRISNTYNGIYMNVFANPGPTLTSNAIKNSTNAIEFTCTPNTTVKSNVITDALVAFDQVPPARGSLVLINQVSDVDAIATPCH